MATKTSDPAPSSTATSPQPPPRPAPAAPTPPPPSAPASKPRRLGRGLSALLGDLPAVAVEVAQGLKNIANNQLTSAPPPAPDVSSINVRNEAAPVLGAASSGRTAPAALPSGGPAAPAAPPTTGNAADVPARSLRDATPAASMPASAGAGVVGGSSTAAAASAPFSLDAKGATGGGVAPVGLRTQGAASGAGAGAVAGDREAVGARAIGDRAAGAALPAGAGAIPAAVGAPAAGSGGAAPAVLAAPNPAALTSPNSPTAPTPPGTGARARGVDLGGSLDGSPYAEWARVTAELNAAHAAGAGGSGGAMNDVRAAMAAVRRAAAVGGSGGGAAPVGAPAVGAQAIGVPTVDAGSAGGRAEHGAHAIGGAGGAAGAADAGVARGTAGHDHGVTRIAVGAGAAGTGQVPGGAGGAPSTGGMSGGGTGGRGFAAQAASGTVSAASGQGAARAEIIHIPIGEIAPNRFQPRRAWDEAAIRGLADSIRASGVMQPVIVRPRPAHAAGGAAGVGGAAAVGGQSPAGGAPGAHSPASAAHGHPPASAVHGAPGTPGRGAAGANAAGAVAHSSIALGVYASPTAARLAGSRPAAPGDPGARYELIAGERRLRAAAAAGLATIPAIVRDVGDREAAEWALVENVQREDLNAMERAWAFRGLSERFGLSHGQIAARVGLDRVSISNAVRLTELEPSVAALIESGRLSGGHGRAILACAPGKERAALAERAAAGGWSVRKTELEAAELAAKLPGRAQGARRGPSRSPAATAERAALEKQLGEHLGTKVRVLTDRTGKKGRLIVEFYGLDHFEGITGKMGFAMR